MSDKSHAVHDRISESQPAPKDCGALNNETFGNHPGNSSELATIRQTEQKNAAACQQHLPNMEIADAASNKHTLPHFSHQGGICEKQPGANEIPVFKPGSDGCDYTSAPDAVKTYQDGQPSSVKIGSTPLGNDMGTSSGSGTMVGKKGDVCKVLTADHVLREDDKSGPANKLEVFTDKGRYPATPGYENPGTDTAILNVKMGKDIGDCKPSKVVDGGKQPKPGDHYSAVSYPHGSFDAYLQEGKIGESKKEMKSEVGITPLLNSQWMKCSSIQKTRQPAGIFKQDIGRSDGLHKLPAQHSRH